MKPKAICIIPARGGSKRIPRKNLKPFLGKPIIAYSINAALNCKLFDRVIVSTDDKEIVEVATSLGAEVPFLRSEVNSNDYATTYDVIKEVSEQLLKENYTAQFTCCLYPTAPFVTTSTLIESYNRLNADTIDAVFSYTQFDYPIQRRLKMDKGLLTMAEPQFLKSRSQDLEEFYHDAGQFYFYNTEKYLSAGSVFNLKTQGIYFPPNRVQDIDTQEDWEIAELKHKRAFFEN